MFKFLSHTSILMKNCLRGVNMEDGFQGTIYG